MTGSAAVVRGNALQLPLADNTVDLVVTSPPYFALRSYQDGGAHYDGQVGSEATPAAFVDALLAVTAECVRVLKPSGSLWVNLGDKYAAHQTGHRPNEALNTANGRATSYARGAGAWHHDTIRPKSLLGIPWRYTLACIDQLGLILRAEIIWSKPNGLPESVTDRVRRSHEQWFHFTLEPRYYSAVDEIRERYDGQQGGTRTTAYGAGNHGTDGSSLRSLDTNPLGKLPGSVWTIPTEPLQVPDHVGVDHFAAFPTEWPRRIITGWSPREVCSGCGEGRRPVVAGGGLTAEGEALLARRGVHADQTYSLQAHHGGDPTKRGIGHNISGPERRRLAAPHTITGSVCGCTPYTDHPGTPTDRPTNHQRSATLGNGVRDNPGGGYGNADRTGPWREYHHDQWTPPPTTPGVVLDPFGGTGTTALVAKALGRTGITIDLSADYCRLARWRTQDPDQQAKVLGFRRSDQARAADSLPMDTLFDLDGTAV